MSKRNKVRITLTIQGWPWKSSVMLISMVALVALGVVGAAIVRG